MVERLREQLSNESMAERITRMLQQLELAADGGSLPGKSVDDQTAADNVAQAIAFSKETSTGLRQSARRRKPVRR